jgi:hypothetical protein
MLQDWVNNILSLLGVQTLAEALEKARRLHQGQQQQQQEHEQQGEQQQQPEQQLAETIPEPSSLSHALPVDESKGSEQTAQQQEQLPLVVAEVAAGSEDLISFL